MIVYDGTYRLEPDPIGQPKPESRWVCAWRVRMINLAESQPAVRHLKPTIVIATPAGSANGLTTCAEGVGKYISMDFKLDVKQVLWFEQVPSKSGRWHAAVFRPQDSSEPDFNYNIQWRPVTPNEVDLIKSLVPDIAADGF